MKIHLCALVIGWLLTVSAFGEDLDRFLKWNGKALPQQKTGVAKLTYVPPNEYWAHYFLPSACDSNGVLLAVGSFRGLTDVADGGCPMLIQFDYDFGIKTFNLINLQLISLAKDRFQYFAMLLSGLKEHPAIDLARKGEISLIEMVNQMGIQSSPANFYIDRWKEFGVVYEGDEAVALLKDSKQKLDGTLRWSLFAFRSMEAVGSLKHTFLGNDRGFSHVQQMARTGRIKVVQGDLLNGKVLGALGQQVSENGMVVSAFDISNVSEWILKPGEGLAPTAVGRYDSLIEKIELLPTTESFKLLFTTGSSLLRSPAYEKERQFFNVPLLPKPWEVLIWHYHIISKRSFALLREIYQRAEKESGEFSHGFGLQANLYKMIPLSPLDPGYQMIYEMQ